VALLLLVTSAKLFLPNERMETSETNWNECKWVKISLSFFFFCSRGQLFFFASHWRVSKVRQGFDILIARPIAYRNHIRIISFQGFDRSLAHLPSVAATSCTFFENENIIIIIIIIIINVNDLIDWLIDIMQLLHILLIIII